MALDRAHRHLNPLHREDLMSLRLRRPGGLIHRRRSLPEQHRGGTAQGANCLQARFERQLRLVELALPVMERLIARMGTGHGCVVLTDPHGTVLQAITRGVAQQGALTVARPASTGRPVEATERQPALCRAFCIFDPAGQLLGRLQALIDDQATGHRLSVLVRLSARTIENRWFDDTYRFGLRLHFHPRNVLLGSVQEARVAISPDGRILGANANALTLLATHADALLQQQVEDVFGVSVAGLLERSRVALDGRRVVVLETGRSAERSLFARVRLDRPASRQQPAGAAFAAGPGVSAPCPSAWRPGSMRPPGMRRTRRGPTT